MRVHFLKIHDVVILKVFDDDIFQLLIELVEVTSRKIQQLLDLPCESGIIFLFELLLLGAGGL